MSSLACRLSPPQAPRWDMNLNLPIINRHYSMQELVNEQDNLYADASGLVYFLSESELDSFRVGDRLAIESFNNSFVTTVGRYTVPSPGAISTQISFRDIYSGVAALNGQSAPIPGFTFALPLVALPNFDNYILIESADGSLTISLRNGLPVPLGTPLQVEIRDRKNGTSIAIVDFDIPIPPGGEMARTVNLAQKTFGNNLSLRLSGRSPGSEGKLIERINPDSKLIMTVALSDLQVERAAAKIGPQIISDAGEIPLGDSLKIVTADLRSGALFISAQGDFPVSTWLVLTFWDFYNAQNVVVKDSFQIVAHGASSKNFDLSSYSFRPLPAAFGQQKIRFAWKIRTTNKPNEFITLASSDNMRVTFKSSKILFARINGGFNAKTINIAPQTFRIKLPEGLDSLRLAEASLRMILRNGINFPVRADFQVEGVSNQGKPVGMSVRGDIKAGQVNGTPVESQIVLNRNNSNLIQFLNALPKSINVQGKITFGNPAYTGIIRDTDVVNGTLRFDTPLAFVLPAQRVESDIEVLKIEEGIRSRLKDNLPHGKILARFANHLPMAASISLNLAQQEAEVFTKPDLIIGPFTLAMPDLNLTTGRVTREKISQVELTLTEAQLELFQKSPLYTGVLIELPGTNGKLVRITAADYIHVQALAVIAFTMDSDGSK
ncbi:MAG: hypothetical protein ONB44_12310 [candidate division KSB1 bacterium]|nr:hypothetical protein [candidate division KSB1 bacterium]